MEKALTSYFATAPCGSSATTSIRRKGPSLRKGRTRNWRTKAMALRWMGSRMTPLNVLHRAMDWLIGQWQWPNAALFAGVWLLALAPIVLFVGEAPLAWVYLQLP